MPGLSVYIRHFSDAALLHKGDVTRDKLQQRFFAQQRVNFSRNIVQNELGNMHVTRDDFSRNPTRNILRNQATRVQAM